MNTPYYADTYPSTPKGIPWLWIIILLGMITAIGIMWNNSSSKGYCELCDLPATAIVRDRDGSIHYLCDEHSGEMILKGGTMEGKP